MTLVNRLLLLALALAFASVLAGGATLSLTLGTVLACLGLLVWVGAALAGGIDYLMGL